MTHTSRTEFTASLCIGVFLCTTQLLIAQEFNKIDPKLKHKIDSTYSSWIKKYQVVGMSIAIVDQGEIVYARGYGYADLAGKVNADEKTIYRIGSITKSFTALSILQLQDQNLLQVDHSVKLYLPDLTIGSRFQDSNAFTLNNMLSHTSGLPCDIANGAFCDAPPDIKWTINELNKQTSILPENYRQAYSNIGYGLLGEVVARVSKLSYEAYLKKNIFEPLNMRSTYVDCDSSHARYFSKAYYNKKEVREPLIRDQGAGFIYSTVTDMSNYMIMLLNKGRFHSTQVASAHAIKEMEKDRLTDIQLSTNETYGYGIYSKQIQVKDGQDSLIASLTGHEGDTYVFHSDLKYIPELNVGVVILTNTDNGGRVVSASRLLKLYLESKGKKINFNYKDKRDTLITKPTGTACTPEEIKGVYNMGALVVPVKNAKKIKFSQGPATITFTQKKSNPAVYKAKARVYHVIPVKIKDQEFTFVKLNNNIYLKVIFPQSGDFDYMAIKSEPVKIPANWKTHYGKYKAIGKVYACADCPFINMENASLTLSEKNKFVLMQFSGKSADTKTDGFLDILSDNLAVTGGITRGNGETVRILPNGNIYYSGFEFAKVK